MEQRKMNEPWKEFEPRLYTILDKMVRFGVDGIECYHPSADEQQSELLVQYAKEHDLIITRGSDFHSDVQKRDFSRYHGMD
jgi:predicted metal-dependent phosphoesterase TrpH